MNPACNILANSARPHRRICWSWRDHCTGIFRAVRLPRSPSAFVNYYRERQFLHLYISPRPQLQLSNIHASCTIKKKPSHFTTCKVQLFFTNIFSRIFIIINPSNFFLFFSGVRSSPVNIVATATLVTEGAILDDEDEDEVDEGVGEAESEEAKSADGGDEEVDVEECSSVDDGPLSVTDELPSCRKLDGLDNDIERTTTTTRKSHREHQQPRHRNSCNSDELRNVECHLETKELWDKFNELGTEMIITKTGRWVISSRNSSQDTPATSAY